MTKKLGAIQVTLLKINGIKGGKKVSVKKVTITTEGLKIGVLFKFGKTGRRIEKPVIHTMHRPLPSLTSTCLAAWYRA